MKRIFVWCVLAALLPSQGFAAAATEFSGTWTGTFAIHFPDGRVADDMAWMVLQQSGATVAGTVGPKASQQGPIRDVTLSGDTLKFIADTSQGKILKFALKRDGEKLMGEAIGEIGDDRVRVVLSMTRTAATAVAARDPLYERMLALDTEMFDSFNRCSDPAQFAKHEAFFAKDVEFYHDIGGLTPGRDALMVSTRNNVCGKFRRELDAASFRVYPIPGYGAMVIGTHRFCHTPTTCEGIAEFTSVWREKDGVWQITRALSYAHRSLEGAAASK